MKNLVAFVFLVIALLCLVLFLKPILSLWASHTFFMSYRITYFTELSFLSLIFWQRMTVFAVCSSCIFSRYSIPFKNICFLRDQLKMFGITARGIVAKMVDLCESSFLNPSWNWPIKIRIKQAVYSLGFAFIINHSIALSIERAKPVPALGFRVYRYFSKDSFAFFWRQYYCKHTSIIPYYSEV